MATKPYDYKIVLVGDGGVGKSSILRRYAEDDFTSSYDETICVDFKIRTIDIDGKKIKLQIWDTGGKEMFRDIAMGFCKGANGIILMYDVTNEKSFDNIRSWIREIEDECGTSDKEMLIIGNKCDLSDSRVVSKERGESLADEYGFKFMETSAKASINVEEAFVTLVYDIKKNIEKNEVEYNNTNTKDNNKTDKKKLLRNLNKAKRDHGTIPVRFLKVIVAGSGAAGKTNFINLLMKKQFKKDHHSTNIVHANHAVSFRMATFQESSKVDGEVTWVELDSELEIGYLQSVLLPETLPKQQLTLSSTGTAKRGTATITTPPGSTEAPIKPQYQSKAPKQQHSPFLNWFTRLFNTPIKDSNLSTVDSILNLKSSQSGAPIYQPGAVLNIITLLDTGGQPEYIHLLPTININPTVTFFVHNLSKGLDDQVLVEYSQDGKHVFTPYHLSYSNIDMIKFLMSTVNDSVERPVCNTSDLQLGVTPGSDDKSYICMVGTHADKVSQMNKENVGETLTTLINKTQCHASVWYRENKNVLFSVDNTTAGKRYTEDPVAKDIRNRIEILASKKEAYELPITWMLLQLEIRQVCSKRDKSYISFSDCVTIAIESGLISNEEEVKSVLQYHHLLGVLIYFHEIPGLCDYVIVDHQWWFDKLSNVICITFQEDFLDYQAVRKLKYQGKLSKELVKHVEWKDDIKEEFFFSLLIRMKIITPVDNKQDCTEEYFIPFVLSAYNLQQENKILSQYGYLQEEPLLIQFYSGLLPRGLFCSLLVQLLQYPLKGSEPHFSQGDTQHAFSNLFTFSLPNAYSMSLLDKLSYLEVQIRHPKKAIDIPVHAEIYNYLMYVLTDVCNHLKFNFERLQYGFLCKCCKHTEDHIAILPPISSMVYAKCSIDSICQMELGSSHFIWFSYDQLPQNRSEQHEISKKESTELSVLHQFYKDLQNGILIDELLPSLVTKRIITINEKILITESGKSINERCQFFLDQYISKPLLAGDSSAFYKLIQLMDGSSKYAMLTAKMKQSLMIESSQDKISELGLSDTAQKQLPELDALVTFYEKICSTLPTDELLPQLVTQRVITLHEKSKIDAVKTEFEKAQYLLDRYIARPLSAGDPRFFNILLDLMSTTSKCSFLINEIRQHLSTTLKHQKFSI